MGSCHRSVMTAGTLSNQSGNGPGAGSRVFGLYLHIPFCVRKCLYCSFYSVAGRSDIFQRYVNALKTQLHQFAQRDLKSNEKIRTIFFGGGTPSVLPAPLLTDLLSFCLDVFHCREKELEISLEANPATINGNDLDQLYRAGFNRLSIGVQSFLDEELQSLGRPHTAREAGDIFSLARKAGFSNVSVDLMYGLPGQNLSGWKKTLTAALELEPDHLSIYELTIEEETVFANLHAKGMLNLPDEDDVLAMMKVTLEETGKNKYHRYEISNYARPGKECRHNINYWMNGSYLGAGAGAVSCLSGCRMANVAYIDDYCRRVEAGESPVQDTEQLDREAQFRETVVMGLRMTRGVSMKELEYRFGISGIEYYGETLKGLQDDDLLAIEGDRLKLTDRGLMLANRVMAVLV